MLVYFYLFYVGSVYEHYRQKLWRYLGERNGPWASCMEILRLEIRRALSLNFYHLYSECVDLVRGTELPFLVN